MIEFLNNLDTSVFLAINGHHSPFFDSFMTLFTGRFIWIPMYVMVLWILFRGSHWKNALLYTAAIGMAVFLTDQTCASLIRPAVERLRPSNLQNTLSEFAYIVNDYRGGSYGFPSCHSANSFALATFLILFVRRRGFSIFIIGWALLNSYSRLYLGVHYPGDLLVGAVIGTTFSAFCYIVSSRFEAPGARAERHRRLSAPILSLQGRPLTTLFRPLSSPSNSSSLDTSASDTSSSNTSNSSSAEALTLTPAGMMIATFAATLAAIIIASLLTLL